MSIPAAEEQKTAVALRAIEKRFADTLVLENIDLNIPDTQFVSIVGPSGCGKSTLLRIIAGLTATSSGSIELFGASVETSSDRVADFSFVFQDATLLPWRTVVSNVELPLEIARVSRAERRARAERVLEMVGLQEVTRSYPRQLSGGMKMRVSIARALVSEPRILLMDEPYAALDELTRQKLQEELLAIWQRTKMTVAFVTHNVFEAVFLSQKVFVMASHPGRVIAEIPIVTASQRDEEFRSSTEFGSYLATITRLIHKGIN